MMNEEQLMKRKQILAFSDAFYARIREGVNPYRKPYQPKTPIPHFDSDFCEESFERYFSRNGQGVELRAEDVLLLEEGEWLDVLEEFRFICDNLIIHQRCWCGLPPCASLPIAALAKILISGSDSRRGFEILKNIKWYCLPVIRGKIFKEDNHDEWIQELSKQSSLPRSLIKKDDRFDMNMHAGARLLEVIGRSDLFEAFKANPSKGKWGSSRELSGYLEYAQYEKVWVGAKAGDPAAFLTLLRYVDGARYYSVFSKDDVAVRARELNEMYQAVVRSYAVVAQPIAIEDAERLLLISFACGIFSADQIAFERGWQDDDHLGSLPDSENIKIVTFYKDLREVALAFSCLRSSFVSSAFRFIGLLDILNNTSVLGSDVSFSADFIRYHRCIMRVVAADGKNCAGWVGEMEEIANRRCAMYKGLFGAKDGAHLSHDADSDPLGVFFVNGLVRLYLGEFGLKSETDKAQAWIYRMFEIDYAQGNSTTRQIGEIAQELENTSYACDPGFILIANYFLREKHWAACYAWRNAARMLRVDTFEPTGNSVEEMDVLAEKLSPRELGAAQSMTRQIVSRFRGKLPPKYQSDLAEYVGLNGGQPDYFLFRTDSLDPDAERLGHFLRGLNFLGICDTEYLPDGSIYDLGESTPCRVELFRDYDYNKPSLPLDYAQALACLMRAFGCSSLPSSGCFTSEDGMLVSIPGFQVKFKDAMMTYLETTPSLDLRASVINELARVIEKLPDCVSLADLRKFLKE